MTKHLTTAWLLWLVCAAASPLAAAPPVPSVVLPCVFVKAIDGDTLDCDVTIRVRVRLIDCWCQEANTPSGQNATDSLRLAISGSGGRECKGVVQIPLHSNRLQDVFSFGRVLGHCYVDGQDKSLGEQQIALGVASSEKNGEPGK